MSAVSSRIQPLDELITWFTSGQDPLRLGTERMASDIHGACVDIATRQLTRSLDLRQDAERQTLDDAVASAMERVWAVLCRARAQGNGQRMQSDIQALVRTLAKRALADIIRERKPDGYRLQCAVTYILDRHPEKHGLVARTTLLSRSARYRLAADFPAGPIRSWNKDDFCREKLESLQPDEIELAELVRRLIAWHGHEMQKGELLTCLRDLLPRRSDDLPLDDMAESEEPAVSGSWPDDCGSDARKALSWLWNELSDLPDEQCRSILLRMESEGIEALAVEVGYEAIAAKLEIAEEDLLGLIETMPLEYEKIAGMVQTTLQQARSRRARGWDRIARRYDRWSRDVGRELGLIERWVALLERERHAPIGQGHNA